MKLSLLLPLLFALCFTANAQIVINEIMYNPPESGTDTLEYIELFNNGNSAINLENYTMAGVNLTFPSVVIAPGAYQVIAVKSSAMQTVFGVSAIQWTSGGLSNSGETIALLSPAGDTIDKVSYLPAAPWPAGANSLGRSIVLCNPNTDNNDPANWQDCATATGVTINGRSVFANPGSASACPSGVLANSDFFSMPPWQSGLIPVLTNDFVPAGATATVTILFSPAFGTAGVTANNEILYTPPSNTYCGSDALVYRVCVGADCDEAQVFINVRCYPLYDLETVTTENSAGSADSLNVSCELRAVVHGPNMRPGGLQFTLIKPNNKGIGVFYNTGDFGYSVQEGDLVAARGVITQFNGLTQMNLDTVIKISPGNPLVTPTVVTKLSEDTESSLLRISNLRLVNTAQWTTGMGTGGFNVNAVSDDHPLDTIQIRIDSDIDLYNQPAPTTPFNLLGIGGQFDNTAPLNDGGYQIFPRYGADIQPIVSTQQADFSSLVKILPNPVSNTLFVQLDARFDRLLLFRTDGKILHTMENIQEIQQIDMSTQPNGVYFLRLEKEGKFWGTKVIKGE
jgi:hypothetical protein